MKNAPPFILLVLYHVEVSPLLSTLPLGDPVFAAQTRSDFSLPLQSIRRH